MSQRGSGSLPIRPAWVEIDLGRLRRNFEAIFRDKPSGVSVLSVVKDAGYGHGAGELAKAAVEAGAVYLGVSNLDEAVALREAGITEPILIFGRRPLAELPYCIDYDLTCCIDDPVTARKLAEVACKVGKTASVHIDVDTGIRRYGVHWTEAAQLISEVSGLKGVAVEGVMSHFAMSDEADKSFALQQLERFRHTCHDMQRTGIRPRYRHICNTGGFLDLPEAHFELVRLGILPLGVYPSAVCRRIPGIAPVMTVKSRLAKIQRVEKGAFVGYGMRYQAPSPRRIGVLPIGYGDGFPRVRNEGSVLLHGRRAPVVGANAMDATMIDVTDIPEVAEGDTAVIQGRAVDDEITPQEIARWKQTVSYEVLTGWRERLPRVYSKRT